MQSDRSTAVELRCQNCQRLLGVLLDFRGRVKRRCVRCKTDVVWDGTTDVQNGHGRSWSLTLQTTIGCRQCGRTIAYADVLDGRVEMVCHRCKALSVTTAASRQITSRNYTAESIVALMEERWEVFVKAQARKRAEVAVGLRFDVFKRDGFRCRYCGRSVDDGLILHADHVVPQSKGGPTTLENLVTACFDCNIGKSAKILPVEFHPSTQVVTGSGPVG